CDLHTSDGELSAPQPYRSSGPIPQRSRRSPAMAGGGKSEPTHDSLAPESVAPRVALRGGGHHTGEPDLGNHGVLSFPAATLGLMAARVCRGSTQVCQDTPGRKHKSLKGPQIKKIAQTITVVETVPRVITAISKMGSSNMTHRPY